MIGTMRSQATVETAEGSTVGCDIQYGAFIRDWGYRQGRASYVVGNFGVMRNSPAIASTLKVVVRDIDFQSGCSATTMNPPTARSHCTHTRAHPNRAAVGTAALSRSVSVAS